ncbi:zinc metalloprotease HtpX [Poseidonibacter ostreae]|jgi:heat shock protein HtpX|uniref:Protease HtpX homolog n=1 Tax=Poseidonibacter ostreae TaxID=2654171 RepID=A0A6L4WUP3_9BACT|nr:zinc metalloprotease HtpX [Poseidonibacter ostreae]KAB7884832.1 zinc metalloprotease HtpX [Poseidonibacter ostreae]KAB7890148.1 zinc metalloprotease HtpX [Poseidonibacter ostreae]|tara:strand:- start:2128 stop:2973 length:846 start_codon:yes stop_codon:yes gene_type:complete
MEQAKTIFLLTSLTVLFVFIGYSFGGPTGMLIAFLLAGGMNFYAYYYSDTQVLKHYDATPLEDTRHPVYQITQRLVKKAGLPMPKVYLIPDHTPNAFATGRNHENAAVAVTIGLYEMLNEKELEGVIAHELSHVKHYDILVGTIAAVFAGAIAMIANMMQFGAMFGSNRQNSNPIMMILMAILLPLAASIIQMTVSRSREFMADEGAARMTGNAEGLQSALSKLENYARNGHQIHNATEQTAHMFIINPFSGLKSTFGGLFRTHPTTEDRIARLEELKREL